MKVRNFILGIAIFILTLSVGIYGINTFYSKGPQYNDFCPQKPILNESECINEGGLWTNYSQENIPAPKAVPASGPNGYCDYYYIKCQEDFNKAEEKYSRSLFMIALPTGIIIIAIGAIIFGLEAVGAGLMFGGVGMILYGIGVFWRFANDWLKFLLSLIGLIIVIALAYYYNKKWLKK